MTVACRMEDCKYISKRRSRFPTKTGRSVLFHTCKCKLITIVPITENDSMLGEIESAKCLNYEPVEEKEAE